MNGQRRLGDRAAHAAREPAAVREDDRAVAHQRAGRVRDEPPAARTATAQAYVESFEGDGGDHRQPHRSRCGALEPASRRTRSLPRRYGANPFDLRARRRSPARATARTPSGRAVLVPRERDRPERRSSPGCGFSSHRAAALAHALSALRRRAVRPATRSRSTGRVAQRADAADAAARSARCSARRASISRASRTSSSGRWSTRTPRAARRTRRSCSTSARSRELGRVCARDADRAAQRRHAWTRSFSGKKLQGFDRLDTERDPLSRAFNADVNDLGLPGDVVDTLAVVDGARRARDVRRRRSARGVDRSIAAARRHARELHGAQQPARRGGHRPRRRAQPRRARSASASASRASSSTSATATVDALRQAVHRSSSTPTHRVAHAAAGCSCAFRSAPPTTRSTTCLLRRVRALRVTVVSGAGAARRRVHAAAARAPAAHRRAVAQAQRRRRSPASPASQPAGGYTHHVAHRHGGHGHAERLGLPAAAGRGRRAGHEGRRSSPSARVQINERSLRLQAGNLPRVRPRRGVLPVPERAAELHGLPGAARCGRAGAATAGASAASCRCT